MLTIVPCSDIALTHIHTLIFLIKNFAVVISHTLMHYKTNFNIRETNDIDNCLLKSGAIWFYDYGYVGIPTCCLQNLVSSRLLMK